MWGLRFKRIVIIGGVMVLVLLLGQVFLGWQSKSKQSGVEVSFPSQKISQGVESLGGQILGAVLKVLPGMPGLEEIEIKSESQEAEPIVEPVSNVREQTELLLEAVKDLPQDQIEAVKKQVYQDFCLGLIEEEDGEE